MNSVVIIGRVGRDPEIKYYESGKSRTTFSMAVNRRQGKEDVTDWFNIEMWDKQAETAAEWIKKGALISVEGRIRVNQWQGQDGEMNESYLVSATKFNFEGSKRDAQQNVEAV
ncbi:MAG: single-stranded DNA-binding protein [Candidatus Gastranaerophilales bacterium]|nr:single-stranded DNA-binding protein [Candidatus Gastranaerophilales bacterium]MBR6298529.1 single-stranded DNA-binding protein [Candidatus Gastranaerophilales bacterium]